MKYFRDNFYFFHRSKKINIHIRIFEKVYFSGQFANTRQVLVMKNNGVDIKSIHRERYIILTINDFEAKVNWLYSPVFLEMDYFFPLLKFLCIIHAYSK